MKRFFVVMMIILSGCADGVEARIGPISTPAPVSTPPSQVIVIQQSSQPEPEKRAGAEPWVYVMFILIAVLMSGTFFLIGVIYARRFNNQPPEPPKTTGIYFQGIPERGIMTEADAFTILRQRGYTPEAAAYLIEQAKQKQIGGR